MKVGYEASGRSVARGPNVRKWAKADRPLGGGALGGGGVTRKAATLRL